MLDCGAQSCNSLAPVITIYDPIPALVTTAVFGPACVSEEDPYTESGIATMRIAGLPMPEPPADSRDIDILGLARY